MRKFLYLILLLLCFGKAQADEELEMSNKPLFVSLGSHCEVAAHIRHNGVRTAAFPFDWFELPITKGSLIY